MDFSRFFLSRFLSLSLCLPRLFLDFLYQISAFEREPHGLLYRSTLSTQSLFCLFFLVRKKRMDRPCTYIFGGTFRLKDSHTHTQRRRGPNTSPHETYRGWGRGRQSIEQKVKRIVQSTDRSPERKTVEKMRHESKRKTQKQNANKQKTIEKRCLTNTHTYTHTVAGGFLWGVSPISTLIFLVCLVSYPNPSHEMSFVFWWIAMSASAVCVRFFVISLLVLFFCHLSCLWATEKENKRRINISMARPCR